MSTNSSLASQAFGKAVMIALLVLPTAISIFIVLEVKGGGMTSDHMTNNEPQIVCFDTDVCAIEVNNKWYRISGVIRMDETVPEEYRLEDLVDRFKEIPIDKNLMIDTEQNNE